MEKKLYRSSKNKVISGVCGGLGEYFELDPVIVRVICIAALFVLHVFTILAYIILWIVLPVKNTPDNEIADSKDQKADPKQNSRTLSIVFAAVLILIGVFFLFPNPFLRFGYLGSLIVALFLILFSGKIFYDVARTKEYSLFRISVGFVALSYGVFLCLNKFSFVDSGIFIEYTKNLMPAVLILVGVAIIFRNTANKLPAAILCVVLFVFIGIYSFINGNYAPFGAMGKMMERMNLPSVGRWSRNYGNINVQDFSATYSLPADAGKVVYTIENEGGNLKIGSAEPLLAYDGTGITPEVKTNWNKKNLAIQFENHAADTDLKLTTEKESDINLQVSAGNLDADFKKMSLRNLSLMVNGGAATVNVGEEESKLNFENNLGSTEISLPKNANIRIRIATSMAHISIPKEFKYKDGEYIYNGGGENISISASVKMGNMEFKF